MDETVPVYLSSRKCYSDRYSDDTESGYEYRHVILKDFTKDSQLGEKFCPVSHTLTESEWRNLGIQQSVDWEHYAIHYPEPNVLMFRRPVNPVERVGPDHTHDHE